MSVCAGFAPERDSLTFQTLSPFLGAFALVHWRRSPHSTVGSLAFGVLQFGSKSAFGPRKLWKNQEKFHFNRSALGKLNKDNKCLALVQRNNVKSDFTTDIASSNWWLSGLWCVCVCKSISNFLEIHTPVFERKVRVLAHLEGISLNLRSNYDFNTPASQFHVHLAGEMSDFIFSKVKDREAAHRGDFRPVRISRVQRKVKSWFCCVASKWGRIYIDADPTPSLVGMNDWLHFCPNRQPPKINLHTQTHWNPP